MFAMFLTLAALSLSFSRRRARRGGAGGVAISTHTGRYRQGLSQIELLVGEEGADPARIVIGHCDGYANMDYYHEMLERGVYLEFDLLSFHDITSDRQRIPNVVQLLEEGHADQLLIAQDTSYRGMMHTFGGVGYDYMFTTFIPKLKEAGVTEEQIEQMLVKNPIRLLDV